MSKRRYTDAQLEIVLAKGEHHPASRVAELAGLTLGQTSYLLLKHGIISKFTRLKPRHSFRAHTRGGHEFRPYSPAEDAKLLKLEATGASYAEMGRALGRKPNSCQGRLMTIARHEAMREKEAA